MNFQSCVLAVFIIIISASNAPAQAVIQNGNTEATVGRYGHVTFRGWDIDGVIQRLSFADKSFFSVQIDDELYTNNDRPPAPSKFFPEPVTSVNLDTIVTTWRINGVSLVQRVFPRYTEHGTKITVRYSVTNDRTSEISISSQYLLDIQVIRDGTPFYEPATGYNTKWRTFSGSLPSHIAFTPDDIQHTFNPWSTSLIGLLSLSDSSSPGVNPTRIIAGDWAVLEGIPFVPDAYELPTSGEVRDLGMLLQWEDRSVAPGSTSAIGGFTYGASNLVFCGSNTIVIPPDLIAVPVFPQSKIIRVPVYVLNHGGSALNHPPLEFDAEGVMTFEGGARSVQVPVGSVEPINAKGLEISITYDSIAELSTIPTLGTLVSSACQSAIVFISARRDTVAPELSVMAGHLRECSSQLDTVVASERSNASESGIRSFLASTTNYVIRYLTPRIIPSKEERAELRVKDSMQNAHAVVTTVDVAGNSSSFVLEYCTTPDTLAPQVQTQYLSTLRWMVYVRDDRAWDRMLDKIEITQKNNVTATIPNNVRGLPFTSSVVKIIDTTRPAGFCVVVHDIAGNTTDKMCYSHMPVSSVEGNASIISASISPNPATDHVTLTLPSAAAHDITISDMLGRVVWSGRSSETQLTINTARLEAGKYVVRVQSEGSAVSVPMMIVR